jgi:6-phosphogluconolactonase (cycloisomerase 2 family)
MTRTTSTFTGIFDGFRGNGLRRCLGATAVLTGLLLALASDATAAPRLYAPVYYSEPQTVSGFDSAADGSLTPLGGSPFTVIPGPPFPVSGISGIAFAPEGRRAAVSFSFQAGVQGLSVAADGSPAPAGPPIASPAFTGMAVTPDGRFVYASNGPAGGVRGYTLGADGALAPLAGPAFGSGFVVDIAVSPDGRFLFATTPTNVIKRFSVGADGSLTPIGTTTMNGATLLTASPDGRLLFVGIKGGGDGVASFTIGADGSLTQNGEVAHTGDVSMYYFAVSPDGSHIYMPDANVDGIVTAAVAGDGKLSVLGTMPVKDPGTVAVTPDGRYLYYGSVVNGSRIGVASIGSDGLPTLLPFTIPWASNEPERLLFAPEPTPVAKLTATPAVPGAEVHFDAGASTGAKRYGWDFGDGTKLIDGGPNPRHVYANAGVYKATVTLTDAQGCSTRQVYTGQSTICPGGASATATATVDTLPVITALAAKKKAKSATSLRYGLSEGAKVRFRIESRRHGKTGKMAAKQFVTGASAGTNTLKLTGRHSKAKLEPGRYRAIAVATDSAGGRSAPRSVSFRVLAG